VIHERDDWWHRKYTEDESGKPVPVLAGAQNGDETHEEHPDIDMPKPSYWPLVAAVGLPLIGYGLLFQWALSALGAMVLLVGIYGWALEPSE
jgi:cytochrome c oxidase subunit 1